jgi:hypothetical protein
MKFKINATFTVFHEDKMIVCNAGETVELDEAIAEQYVAAGMAEPAKGGRKPKSELPAEEEVVAPDTIEEAPVA